MRPESRHLSTVEIAAAGEMSSRLQQLSHRCHQRTASAIIAFISVVIATNGRRSQITATKKDRQVMAEATAAAVLSVLKLGLSLQWWEVIKSNWLLYRYFFVFQ